jgi:hypothetical protein
MGNLTRCDHCVIRCPFGDRGPDWHAALAKRPRSCNIGSEFYPPAATCQGSALPSNPISILEFRRCVPGCVAIRPQGTFTDSDTDQQIDRMMNRGLMTQAIGVGLLLLSGCQAVRNMGDDLSRLTSSQPATAQARKTAAAPPAARPRPAPPATGPAASASGEASATTATSDSTARPASDGPALPLASKSESELRALLGTPTSEEDRPPGKRWRYRDGQCTLDVQLYPDVQTKQFGTLAYEVKSDDNTDEGRRLCVAQLHSRIQARNQ